MKIRDLLIGIAIMCLWGFNFRVIKLGVAGMDPLLLTASRFFFAVLPLVFFIKKPAVPWRYLIAYGLSFGVGVWGMVTWSIDVGISAGMASLLLQLSVIFSLLIGWLYLKESITAPKAIGASLALAGLGVIISQEIGQEGSTMSWLGLVFVLLGSLFWSINGVILKAAKTQSVFAFNLWSMLFAPVPLVALAWITHGGQIFSGFFQQFNEFTWFSILFQAYPTTLLGYWVWNRLIVKYSLSSVAPLTLLVPIFGLLGGHLFYSEVITQAQIIAAVLIVTGLFIGQRQWGFSKNRLLDNQI
ncbi:MAG: EamA family transporter [Amphritea sp.]